MGYEKVKEKKKPGPKPGKYGASVKARMEKFNALPPIPGTVIKPPSTKERDFYVKAREILEKQLGKIYLKSTTSNLDFSQIKILKEMVQTVLILDSKETDLPTDTSPEMLKAALNKLNEEISNEPKDTTPTKED